MNKKNVTATRRKFLSQGLKVLAVAVPIVGLMVAQPKKADAAMLLRRRRSGGGCATCR